MGSHTRKQSGQIIIESIYILALIGSLLLTIGIFLKKSDNVVKKYQFKEYKHERKN